VDVVRRGASSTSLHAAAATQTQTHTQNQTQSQNQAPVPLPPKKHRQRERERNLEREQQAPCNANLCEEHEYDEFYPQAYEMHAVAGGTGGPTGGGAVATSSASKHGKQGQQRAATFDVADARDYELKRLGNRRSQQQAAPSKRNGGAGAPIVSQDHHRSHDRERSRSDHRIASYACEEVNSSALCSAGSMSSMLQPANGTTGHRSSSHQHQRDHHARDQQQQQQQQQQQRERREKTFKV